MFDFFHYIHYTRLVLISEFSFSYNTPTSKICNTCNKELSLSNFYISKRNSSGFLNTCKTCDSEKQRLYRKNNLRGVRERDRSYRRKNKDKINKRIRNRYLNDVEYNSKVRKQNQKYREKPENRIIACNKRREWDDKHRHDPLFKIKKNLRRRVLLALNGGRKQDRTFNLIGCTPIKLKQHLENLFQKGMSWDNYGKEWHIDHIIPCYMFDLTSLEQQEKCFHYSNLRPLWAKDNLSRPRPDLHRRLKKKIPTVESLH